MKYTFFLADMMLEDACDENLHVSIFFVSVLEYVDCLLSFCCSVDAYILHWFLNIMLIDVKFCLL